MLHNICISAYHSGERPVTPGPLVLNILSIGKKFILCKVERLNSNRIHYEPSHLDLRCLQKPIIVVCGSERAGLPCLC